MQACQVLWHCFFFLFRTSEDVQNAFGCFQRIIQMLLWIHPILKCITSLNYPALPEYWDALDDFAGIGTKNRECSVKMVDTNNKKPRNRTWLQIIIEYVGHNFSIIPLTDSGAKIEICNVYIYGMILKIYITSKWITIFTFNFANRIRI